MPSDAPAVTPRQRPPRLPLVTMVGVSVCIQLACAALLKAASQLPHAQRLFAVLAIAGVVLLNFVRFLVWNRIHRRYPVSLAYPLSAIFFPAVVALAWITGEHVGPLQVAGSVVVMAGVAVILWDVDVDEPI